MLLIAFLFLCSCDPRFGCVESNFTLSKDSRLPKWYTLPPNYGREDVHIEIFHYLYKVKIITYVPAPNYKKLKVEFANYRPHPITEAALEKERETFFQGGGFNLKFPFYQIIEANGIEEAFEHRDSDGPVAYLYVSDDPKITSYLRKDKVPSAILKLTFEIAAYLLIFLISSTIPIYAFFKSKVTLPWLCCLISFGLTIVLFNIYSVSPLLKGKTGEFYEVFWLIPPIFVWIVTFSIAQIKKNLLKRKSLENKIGIIGLVAIFKA